jgi:hypothetical protein
METAPVTRDIALEHLERVLSSATFRGAERSSALLRFLVEETVAGRAERLKEYTLGAEALGRGQGFDPRTDPIVRAEASRLRIRLERYYASEAPADPIVIVLPKGGYVPHFQARNVAASSARSPADVDTVAGSEPARATRHRPVTLLAAAGVAVLSVLATGVWLARRGISPLDQPLSQFEVELGSGASLGSEVGTDVVLTRDGTRLAYVAAGRDRIARVSTRRLSESETTVLAGTEGARGPFFSPDGRWIGFWTAGKLKKVPVDGGAPVVLCDATDLLGASWSEDGTIIATLNSTSTLWRVPAGGGVPTPIADLSQDGVSPRWPQILPGETHVVYTAVRGFEADRGTIEVLSLRDGARKVVVRGGTFGRYLASGFLSYVNQGTLFVVPFDLDRMETRGPAVSVVNGVSYSPTFGYAQFDISRTGTVVYRKSAGSGRVVGVWLDSTGATEPLVDAPGVYTSPRLSPDGRRFAMSMVDGGLQTVAFYDVRDGRATRISRSAARHAGAVWTPDGQFVVMTRNTVGISWAPADSGTPEPLMGDSSVQVPWTFTPNGDRLAYYEMNRATAFDLWTVPIRSDERGLHAGTPELYLRTASYEVYPTFSPDGRWLAYASNEGGTWEVYVRRFPDDGTKVRVSAGGGRIPRWSRNGRDLFYATDDQRLMVVRHSTRGGSFLAQPPRPWTTVRLADTGVLPNYDLASDGRRVIALVPEPTSVPTQSANHVTVMLNFLGELRRRASAATR